MSDGEDEDLSVCGDERMLSSPAMQQSSSSPRTLPQEAADSLATAAALNAFAIEFVPTQSMACPLIGICSVIVECDEAEDSQLRFTTPQSLRPVHYDRMPRQCEKLQASKKPFWATPKPEAAAVQSRVARGVPAETLTEEQIARRTKSIEVGKATKEYRFHVEQAKLGSDLVTPDPSDSAISKRHWIRVVQTWREELSRRYLSGSEQSLETASMASTQAEEMQGSESGDTTTTVDDDSSSAHGSSR